ncbi:DUF6812 domain-containing protein [Desulfobacula sp.]
MSEKNTKAQDVKPRIIRLKLVDGSQVNGQVNINRDLGYDRLSDLMTNHQDPFLILYNVTAHPGNLDNPIRYKTLFINKAHILWAEPDEDQ